QLLQSGYLCRSGAVDRAGDVPGDGCPERRPGARMMQGQRVLVGIPTLNEAATIEGVLRTLTRDMPALSIAVVDGGSIDDTCAIVRRLAAEIPLLRLIDYRGGNIAASVNRVARAANADVLVRCDAHAIYPDHYVARLVDSLKRSG